MSCCGRKRVKEQVTSIEVVAMEEANRAAQAAAEALVAAQAVAEADRERESGGGAGHAMAS